MESIVKTIVSVVLLAEAKEARPYNHLLEYMVGSLWFGFSNLVEYLPFGGTVRP
jgi:uncharacterized membrane protein